MTEGTTRRSIAKTILLKKRIAEPQILKNKHQQAVEGLRQSEQHYRALFDQGSEGIVIMTLDHNIVEVNRAFAEMHGYTVEQLKRMNVTRDIAVQRATWRNERIGVLRRMRAGEAAHFEVDHRHRDGHIIHLSVNCSIVNIAGRPFVLGFNQDITERKQMEDELKMSKEELRKEQVALKNKNAALTELMEHMERAKNSMREDVTMNVEEIIMPILKKLELEGTSSNYVALLRHHLNELTSSYGRKISQRSLKLSPREMEICSLLKGGLRTKDISKLLNLSDKTVDKHRRNIRKRLGISNEKVNLATYLQQL